MKRLLLSLSMLGMASILAIGATTAYFSDTEISSANTFTAGTLDLKLDNGDVNVIKFSINNMSPGNQPTGSWKLTNAGSLNGYLDIENILITSKENGCTEPEGVLDSTCGNPGIGEGELQDLVNLRLYVDKDKDGYWSTGDYMIYNGATGSIASSYDLNELIPASGEVIIRAVFDWWSSPNDNLAQGDSMEVSFAFELSQTSGQ